MVIDTIRELNRAVPFKPYVLRLTSGAVHRVPHPDFIGIGAKDGWVVVSDENDYPHWISSLLIEEVTLAPPQAQSS